MRHFILIFIFVIQLALSFSNANELNYSEHLTISDGLAHNGVTDIIEDSRGLFWIGTYDGLNLYNGYEFKRLKNNLEKQIFVSNRIRSLAEDARGSILLGTDEGICIYDYNKEKYKTLYSNTQFNKGSKGPIILDFIILTDGTIVAISEENGLFIFNSDYSILGHFLVPMESNKPRVKFLKGIALDDLNLLIASGNRGLFHFDLKSKKFKHLLSNKIYNSRGICRANQNTVLLTSFDGLEVINVQTSNNAYRFNLHPRKMQNRFLSSVAIDKERSLWLGTLRTGLIKINNVDDFLQNKPVEQSTFASRSGFLRMSGFYASQNHGCWACTFDKGIYRFDSRKRAFHYFNAESNLKNGIITDEIMHFEEYTKSKVFVSTNNGGITLFNTKTNTFEPLPSKIRANSSSGLIFVDSQKDIWFKIGGNQGLVRYKAGSNKAETIDIEGATSIGSASVRTIIEDKYGNIWMGGEGDVYRLKLDKKRKLIQIESLNDHQHFVNNSLSLVRFLYADPLYNFIWIGTDTDGLLRLSIDNNTQLNKLQIAQYKSNVKEAHALSSNFVSCMQRLPNGEFWIGTERGGINKVVNSDKVPSFISFSEKNGLSNNVVKNILFDNAYNLWISTNIGLNKFNTKDFTFRRFTKQEGLPFEDFSFPALKTKNGEFIFGGLNGFISFRPEDLPEKEALPKLTFGEMKLFNQTVLPGDSIKNRILLHDRLNLQKEITLKHNENVFSIELSALHYSSPDNHFIAYRLLPNNEEWIINKSSQRFIDYNGLQPGKYELQVKASNSLNEWTDVKTRNITILQPFWRTNKALLLYFLFILLVIYVVMTYFIRINSLKHKVEIEQLEKDQVKAVNAAKLRFFSNISHEIKTPITLIKGPIDILKLQFSRNTEVIEKLNIVSRQSKKISQLIDQVHDFQRSDAKRLKMDYSHFNFNALITELVKDFEFLAKKDKKHLELIRPKTEIFISADKDKMEKVLNNILNNAFKYTKEGESIQVKFHSEGKNLSIEIKDTGRGIHSDDLPHIFERFYQSSKKQSTYVGGSGIGLAFTKQLVEMHYGYISAESILNEGTTLKLRLPVIKDESRNLSEEKEQEILSVEMGYKPEKKTVEKPKLSSIKSDPEFAEAQVFLAEDNLEMREFISGILASFFKVQAFTNGKECLKAMENEWPDIIISDVLMPEMNGFNLCRQVKSDIKTSHIPVILLTACTSIEDQIQGLTEGADAYIKKPFHVQHLITRTEALLRNRKQLRERFQIDYPLSLEKNMDSENDIAFLEKLYSLMLDNLDNQNLDLDTFAKELYLNRTHFYQKVKALTNQTPFELLKMFRLKKAAELLVQEKLSVNEVYMMTGFKSRTHFSKLFKEKFEVTPGQYASEAAKKFE